MPLAVNDIIQVIVHGIKDAQTILNVFFYRCATAPSTGTEADNISALLLHLWEVPTGILEDTWLDCMPDDYTLRAVRGQRVDPTRTAYVEKLLIDEGNVVNDVANQANLAWVFVKQSELPGRRGRGTTHMLLPANDWALNGELSTGGAAARTALVGLIDDTVTVAAGGVYEPVIFHPGFSPRYSRITHCTIKQEIRVMRRRTVGRGI